MIQIRQKHRPYSHCFGTKSPIPNTSFSLEVWPRKMRLFSKDQSFAYVVECNGPVKNFTLLLDLERGCLVFFYQAKEGFISWSIKGHKDGICFYLKKSPSEGLVVNNKRMQAKDSFLETCKEEITGYESVEKLCLGVHKNQEIDKVLLRGDLRETLPLYFRFGQYFKKTKPLDSISVLQKAELCQIHALLMVKKSQHDLVGIDHISIDHDLFASAYQRIRHDFFRQESKNLYFMPNMNLFHAGRLTGLQFSCGTLSFIFRKKRVFRVVMDIHDDGEIHVSPINGLSSFRIRKNLHLKAERYDAHSSIMCKKGERLYLDNFYF